MGSDSHNQIPAIDYLREVDRGTDQWYHLCKKVREACENYGCFEILYDKIPQQLRAETFSVSKQLFSLPLETKKENLNAKPGRGYLGQLPMVPLYESFGFESDSNYKTLKSLTEKGWPDGGHDQFCTVVSMMKQLDELKNMIHLMILDSYGLGDKSNWIMESKTVLRTMKYMAPPSKENALGLAAHTDKNLSSILCDDQVSGLELQTKDGEWIKLSLSPRSFVFLAGDLLMAWSNGRIHSVKHRVMMCGEKERHSLGAFSSPLDGVIITAQKELVDEEHPRILKDFNYTDFQNFMKSALAKERMSDPYDSEKQLFMFAGIGY